MLAPPAAAGVGRALAWFGRQGGRAGLCGSLLGLAFLACAVVQAAGTWRTPPEWVSLGQAAREIQHAVPDGSGLVAPEALLYAADRRGYRLETGQAAAQRAAGEWGERLVASGPLALVEFYRRHGARYLADVSYPGESADRNALHEAIRGRYHVLVDHSGVLLAELTGQGREDADAD